MASADGDKAKGVDNKMKQTWVKVYLMTQFNESALLIDFGFRVRVRTKLHSV